MKPGDIIKVDIYGHMESARILKVHGMGTVDVERLSDGKCFRVTGLAC
jgi:hypothetical protein